MEAVEEDLPSTLNNWAQDPEIRNCLAQCVF